MSKEDPKLVKTQQNIEKSAFAPFIGFSSSSSATINSKQNNTIIQLLLSLHKKLDIFLTSEKQGHIEEVISDNTSKVQNLKIDTSTEEKPVVKSSTKVRYVWRDPKEQVEEYKRIHGK